MYEVIARPRAAGACQDTVADSFEPLAVTPVGVPGNVAGIMEEVSGEFGPSPIFEIAATVNVYPVPFVSPEIVVLVA